MYDELRHIFISISLQRQLVLDLHLVELLFALLAARTTSVIGKAGIYQNDLAADVNEVVLQTAMVAGVFVEFVHPFLAAEGERLGIETVGTEFNCFDSHKIIAY